MKRTLLLAIVPLILLSGCICGPSDTYGKEAATTLPAVLCDKPYIRVGNGCCLDKNSNKICDNDETTTTQPEAETTVTTAATAATQTTLPNILCSTNADCGNPDEAIVCSGGKVMKITVSYRCTQPGTASAECIGTSKMEAVETCDSDEVCLYGVCVKEDDASGIPTTTLPPAEESTTTLPGATTTTLPGTTTTVMSIEGETTTTLMGFELPCSALPSWSQSQCEDRSCPAGKECMYKPSINPLLPGSCSCKAIAATTTTLSLTPCSGLPANNPLSCSGRICPLGKTCKYNAPIIPGLKGTCSCKSALAITTTTLWQMGFPSFSLPSTCSSSFPACASGSCPAGQYCSTRWGHTPPIPVACECRTSSTTTTTSTTTTLFSFGGFRVNLTGLTTTTLLKFNKTFATIAVLPTIPKDIYL